MPIHFASGAVLDDGGQVHLNGVADPALTAVVESPNPEPSPEPVPAEGQPVPPADGELPPAEPPPPAPPAEPAEEEGEDALVLPPTTKSQRQFVRRLLRENAQYQQRVPSLEQQVATLTALLQQLQQGTPAPQTPPPPSPGQPSVPAEPAGPPRPQMYATHEEYLQAHTTWYAQQAVRQALAQRDAEEQGRRQAEEQRQAQASQEARMRAWQAKLAEGRQQFADFDFALGNPAASLTPQVQPVVVETVLESPHGPALLHYLGSHPDITAHLNTLPPLAASRFLGEIEAFLRTPPAPAAPPAPVQSQAPPAPPSPPPVVPAAPPPAPLVPVGGGNPPVSPVTFQRGMSLEAYERMRQQDVQRRSA